MLETTVDSVRPTGAGDLRMVLLRVKDSNRYLSIWIGAAEADAIAAKQHDVPIPRPLTHDLLRTVIETTGRAVNRVIVSELKDNTFFAKIVLQHNGTTLEVDSRPSDAIALAVRSEAPIFVEDEVMERAGVELHDASGVLEITDGGHGFLRQVSAQRDTGDVQVSASQIERMELKPGDNVSGQVRSPLGDEQDFQLAWVEKINGLEAVVTHDLRPFGLPVSLVTPHGWPPPPQRSPGGVNLAPVLPGLGEMGITVLTRPVGEATAQQVFDRVLSESEGAFELLEDEGTFDLPAGFQVTGLVRTVKTFAAAMSPGKLLENWLSLEGAVTRWVIAVVDGSAVIVVLEAADWEQGKAVEGLLSRMRIY